MGVLLHIVYQRKHGYKGSPDLIQQCKRIIQDSFTWVCYSTLSIRECVNKQYVIGRWIQDQHLDFILPLNIRLIDSKHDQGNKWVLSLL